MKNKVNEDLSLLERIKGFNTTRSALAVVFDNDTTLENMSTRYNVPKAVLQTLMFREQRFIDLRDTAADVLTDMGLRQQSSTGLMQVTTRTATEAINYAVAKGITTYKNLGISANTPLSYSNKNDRSIVWNLLNSNSDFNIEVAAQIVRMNADIEKGKKDIANYNQTEMTNLFARYNGTGKAAQEYGTECYRWCKEFSWYN